MTITYQHIISFLLKNGWRQDSHQSDRFSFFIPPSEMGFPNDYRLPIPIRFSAKDYNEYLKFTAETIADFYDLKPEEVFFQVDDYLDILKRCAIYLKLSSNEVQFDNTLAVSQISKFLQNLTKSFESYTKVRFRQLFSKRYHSDFKRVNKAANSFVELTSMRLVDLEYKSFSFGVSVDTMMGKENIDHNEIKDWRKKVLGEYEDDVLEADFHSREGIDRILETFESEEDRKAIFSPFFRSINTKSYSVHITTSDYVPKRKIERVPISTVKIITPSSTREKSNYNFFTLVIPIEEEGRRSINIKKDDLEKSIFANKINTIELNRIKGEGGELYFQDPLKVYLDSTPNGNFLLTIDRFDIFSEASSFNDAQEALMEKIWEVYDAWQNRLPEFEARNDYLDLSNFFQNETELDKN